MSLQQTRRNLEGKVRAYSGNVIFMDGEFTGLFSDGTEFLSIGLIKPDGEELYLELSEYDESKINDWTRENVLPYLTSDEKVTKDEARERIREFVGKGKPFLLADANQFDWMGICGLFGVYDQPFNYLPIDFVTILFANGVDPDIDRRQLAKSFGIDVSGYRKHNALDDARVLKETYEKIIEQIE